MQRGATGEPDRARPSLGCGDPGHGRAWLGRIIIINSAAGRPPPAAPHNGPYAVNSAALDRWTAQLAVELDPPVTAHSLHPGDIASGMAVDIARRAAGDPRLAAQAAWAATTLAGGDNPAATGSLVIRLLRHLRERLHRLPSLAGIGRPQSHRSPHRRDGARLMTGRAPTARRACLVLPADNPRHVAKARALDIDQVVLDLEDGVASDAKNSARDGLPDVVAGGDWRCRLLTVRVNAWDTPWTLRDLTAVARLPRVGSVVLPKVASPADVLAAALVLAQLEHEHSRRAPLLLEAQLETPSGMLAAAEIAAAHPRLDALVFGPADYAASTGLPSRTVEAGPLVDPLLHPMSQLVQAARSAGVNAVDGPHLLPTDADGSRISSERAAALGYDGKWVLHPAQLEVTIRAFTPTPAEVSRAQAVVSAHDRASAGSGALQVGGEMVDTATRRIAERVLARASRVVS